MSFFRIKELIFRWSEVSLFIMPHIFEAHLRTVDRTISSIIAFDCCLARELDQKKPFDKFMERIWNPIDEKCTEFSDEFKHEKTIYNTKNKRFENVIFLMHSTQHTRLCLSMLIFAYMFYLYWLCFRGATIVNSTSCTDCEIKLNGQDVVIHSGDWCMPKWVHVLGISP